MERNETIDESKTTVVIPTELLDDFKHLAIDMKTTVTALIVESMRLYLKEIKKKWIQHILFNQSSNPIGSFLWSKIVA
jgi:hypothetical protein